MFKNIPSARKSVLLIAVLMAAVAVQGASSQTLNATPSTTPAPQSVPAAPKPSLAATRVPMRERMYYESLWGIDSLKVKYTESGEMIRFSYRVVDPAKAVPLNDKKAEPALYDPQAGVQLVVPQLEKIGKLRQSSTPVEGMTYWMAFSNTGRRVRPGDHVNVSIGNFHAMNLVVQ